MISLVLSSWTIGLHCFLREADYPLDLLLIVFGLPHDFQIDP
jgi:hypothetical protein